MRHYLRLREFYRWQAERLMRLARECPDQRTRDSLVRMADNWIDKLVEIEASDFARGTGTQEVALRTSEPENSDPGAPR